MRGLLIIFLFASFSANAQDARAIFWGAKTAVAGPPAGFCTSTTATASDYPLESSTTAIAAYSLRKLKTGYTGSCIRIQRSLSDAAQTDIGFDANGNLDTATLKAFQGSAGDAFVVVLYDQSGNGKHAYQTDVTQAPHLVLTAVACKPALYFGGANDWLFVPSSTSYFNNLHAAQGTVNVVFSPGMVADPNNIYLLLGNNAASTLNRGYSLFWDDRTAASRNNNLTVLTTKGTGGQAVISDNSNDDFPAQTWHTAHSLVDNTNATAATRSQRYKGTTALAQNSTVTNSRVTTDATFDMRIGANTSTATTVYFAGYMTEIIFHNTQIGSTERAAITNSQKNYYGIN